MEPEATFLVKLHDNDPFWMPAKAYPTDAGFDLKARAVVRPEGLRVLEDGVQFGLHFHDTVIVLTGVFLELHPGWEAQVRSRSGMAAKCSVHVLNSPGTIDAGYRNEIGVILHLSNGDNGPFIIKRGDRIAQLVIQKIPYVVLVPAARELDTPDRGMGGFGSTGTKG
jgi:deoxyuridine 5'-triphosphate nucleotidohydrolase